MKKIVLLVILSVIFCISCVNNHKKGIETMVSEDRRGFYLEPHIVKFNKGVFQLTGINQENSVGILNGKGEIASLTFDEMMRPKEKVITKGFPGFSEGDLEFSSDPEFNLVWLRRGAGVYFADLETGKTGHSISMRPGSKIFQIFLSNPDEKIWWITYGVSHFAVDEYNLKTRKKNTLDITLKGQIWPFGENRFLLHSTNFMDTYEWRFVDKEFKSLNPSGGNQLTKMMNNFPDLYLSYDRKEYSLKTRIIITSTMTSDYSILWDINENGKEENVTITPFSAVQQPDDIQSFGEILQFSSDGKWFDMSAKYKTHDTTKPPVERVIYYVDRSFPAGVSPPIRLGLPHYLFIDPIIDLLDGTFMNHNTWGPCYVMQDGFNTLKIFKLNDGLEWVQKSLAP